MNKLVHREQLIGRIADWTMRHDVALTISARDALLVIINAAAPSSGAVPDGCVCFSGTDCRAYPNCRLQPIARMTCAINDPSTPPGVKSTYQEAVDKIDALAAAFAAVKVERDVLDKLCDDRFNEIADLKAKLEAAKRDAEYAALLRWAESNPEKAYSAITSWWAMCGAGCREIEFMFSNCIKGAKEAALKEGKS